MSHLTIVRCLLAGLLLAPALAQAEELVENPAYVSWAKHQPGTKVDTEMAMDIGGQQMKVNIARELLKVEEDHVLIEATTNMTMPGVPAGKGQKQKMKIPARVAKGQEDLPEGSTGEVKVLANETVEAAGKSYDCRVVEFTGTSQGMKSTGKIWNSVEIPGATVKMDMNLESPGGAGTMKMNVVSVSTK